MYVYENHQTEFRCGAINPHTKNHHIQTNTHTQFYGIVICIQSKQNENWKVKRRKKSYSGRQEKNYETLRN